MNACLMMDFVFMLQVPKSHELARCMFGRVSLIILKMDLGECFKKKMPYLKTELHIDLSYWYLKHIHEVTL